MVKVKAIINFNDLQENKSRKIGDFFECSIERASFLVEHNAVEPFVEEIIVPEIKLEEVKEEPKHFKNKKKKSKK